MQSRSLQTFVKNWNAAQKLLAKSGHDLPSIPEKNFDVAAALAYALITQIEPNEIGNEKVFLEKYDFICKSRPEEICRLVCNSEHIDEFDEFLLNIIYYPYYQKENNQFVTAVKSPDVGNPISAVLQNLLDNTACMIYLNEKTYVIYHSTTPNKFNLIDIQANKIARDMSPFDIEVEIPYPRGATFATVSIENAKASKKEINSPHVDMVSINQSEELISKPWASKERMLRLMANQNLTLDQKLETLEALFETIKKKNRSDNKSCFSLSSFFYNTTIDNTQRQKLTIIKQVYYSLIADAINDNKVSKEDKEALIKRVNAPDNLIDYAVRFKGTTATRKLFNNLVSHAEKNNLVSKGILSSQQNRGQK